MYGGQTALTVSAADYLNTPQPASNKTPASGIAADLSIILSTARRLREKAINISYKIDNPKPSPTNTDAGLVNPSNLRSALDELNAILNSTEGYLVDITGALGSL